MDAFEAYEKYTKPTIPKPKPPKNEDLFDVDTDDTDKETIPDTVSLTADEIKKMITDGIAEAIKKEE